MKKEKWYRESRFSAEVLKEAIKVVEDIAKQEEKKSKVDYNMLVESHDSKWHYDTPEEFFADFRKDHGWSLFNINYNYEAELGVASYKREVLVSMKAHTRADIEAVFDVFERHRDASKLEPVLESSSEAPVVFIGHGHNPCWKELKDHLQEQHDIKVVAYETGARAGHSIRDILEQMVFESSFALLVFTGEERQEDGAWRARQNVIHEAGLFQGRLGFSRAIILLEDGVDELSNVQGVQHIRFSKNNIKEVFGDVLATLRRESKKMMSRK